MPLPRRTIQLGVDDEITVEEGAPYKPYAWPGGYPIAYYTADGDTLCARCATEQEEANSIEPELTSDDDRIIACDILEGSAIDHGIVQCANCYAMLVDIDPDDEWECSACGAVNDTSDRTCACGHAREE